MLMDSEDYGLEIKQKVNKPQNEMNEVHRTLCYLWYSGSLSEEEFLMQAFVVLTKYNLLFSFDEL